MRRLVFLLFFAIPTLVFAQKPWEKEYLTVDKNTGRGSVGSGDWTWYTRVDGVFSGSKPGNGKEICDVWHWWRGVFLAHEAYILKSKANREMRKLPGSYEAQRFDDGGTWIQGTLGNDVRRITGLRFNGVKHTLFKGVFIGDYFMDAYYIDGVLIDYDSCRQQQWINNQAGPWEALDDESKSLMEQYDPAHAFIMLKNSSPEMFDYLMGTVSDKLEDAIKRPRTRKGLSLGYGDISGLTEVFQTYPVLKVGLKPDDVSRIVKVINEKMSELGGVKEDYVATIRKYYPKEVYDSPAFKRCLFRQIADDSYRGADKTGIFDRTDYYELYHDYADLSADEINEMDDAVYERILNLNDLEYYRRLFPEGRHIAVVNDLYAEGTGAGLYRTQVAELETDLISEVRQFLSDRVIDGEKGPYDFSGRPVHVSSMTAYIDRKNQNRDPRLDRYLSICTNLKKLFPEDPYYGQVIKDGMSYLQIVDGFWAADNSTDMGSCVGKEFFSLQSGLNPRAAISPTNFGYEVKYRFEEALKLIESIQDENDWNDYLLSRTYDHLYDKYAEYVEKVNENVHSGNVARNREQHNNSSFEKYSFDDKGRLVVTLKNYDKYVYVMENGEWRFVSGNLSRKSNISIRHKSIDDAIKASEQASSDFWGLPL